METPTASAHLIYHTWGHFNFVYWLIDDSGYSNLPGPLFFVCSQLTASPVSSHWSLLSWSFEGALNQGCNETLVWAVGEVVGAVGWIESNTFSPIYILTASFIQYMLQLFSSERQVPQHQAKQPCGPQPPPPPIPPPHLTTRRVTSPFWILSRHIIYDPEIPCWSSPCLPPRTGELHRQITAHPDKSSPGLKIETCQAYNLPRLPLPRVSTDYITLQDRNHIFHLMIQTSSCQLSIHPINLLFKSGWMSVLPSPRNKHIPNACRL